MFHFFQLNNVESTNDLELLYQLVLWTKQLVKLSKTQSTIGKIKNGAERGLKKQIEREVTKQVNAEFIAEMKAANQEVIDPKAVQKKRKEVKKRVDEEFAVKKRKFTKDVLKLMQNVLLKDLFTYQYEMLYYTMEVYEIQIQGKDLAHGTLFLFCLIFAYCSLSKYEKNKFWWAKFFKNWWANARPQKYVFWHPWVPNKNFLIFNVVSGAVPNFIFHDFS